VRESNGPPLGSTPLRPIQDRTRSLALAKDRDPSSLGGHGLMEPRPHFGGNEIRRLKTTLIECSTASTGRFATIRMPTKRQANSSESSTGSYCKDRASRCGTRGTEFHAQRCTKNGRNTGNYGLLCCGQSKTPIMQRQFAKVQVEELGAHRWCPCLLPR
jgi:hypothetical protein